MKGYPKKYYASSHSHILLSSKPVAVDILSVTHFSSNTLSLMDVIYTLVQQVMMRYQGSASLQSLIVSYDSLVHYMHSHHPFGPSDVYTSLSATINHIQSLGLFDQSSSLVIHYQPDYRMMVKTIVSQLYTQGFLHQGKISYFWDLIYGCSVPDSDVIFIPRALDVHRVRYFIDMKKESVIVHTPYPHTIFGDVALAVHPADRRYRKMIGKKVIVPIINRIIPIIADEAIDISAHENGIKRIVPCHDKESFLIAQRHNLPLDIYAYDAYGIYTHHANIYQGKKAIDFLDNVVQYLQDIHNYDGNQKVLLNIPFSRSTQHYLDQFLADGWMVNTDTILQLFADFVQSEACFCPSEEKQRILGEIVKKDSIAITASHGTSRIPLSHIPDVSVQAILAMVGTKKSSSISLALILYDLWYDGILPDIFSIDQLIDIFLVTTHTGALLGETYCQQLSSLYVKNDRILSDIKKLSLLVADIKNAQPSAIETFVDLLDTCPLIQHSGIQYTRDKRLRASDFTYLNDTFLASCAPAYLQQQSLRHGGSSCKHIYADSPLSLDNLLLEFIISQIIFGKNSSLSLLPLQDSFHISSKKNITDCIKPLADYSLDTVRLALLQDTLDDINSSELVIQKVWNVCRYVYMHLIASGSVQQDTVGSFFSLIHENTIQLTPFDQWIIYRFGEMITKLTDVRDSVFSLQYRISVIMDCIVDDFAVKYIEICKQRKGPLSHTVMLLCLVQICDILAPLMPLLVDQIRKLFAGYLPPSFDIQSISLPTKNYKIHLLMMIIGGLKKLKSTLHIKNHESLDICIQASTDMNHFIQEHYHLLDTIIHIQTLTFLTVDQDIPTDYLQEHVIDIALGVKAVQQTISDSDRLHILLKEKNEYLQHLRALMGSSFNPDKELKITKLKDEIHDIEYQLVKVKKR